MVRISLKMAENSYNKRKAILIEGMVRRRQWSMNYKTLEDTVSKMSQRHKKDAEEIIDDLVKKGWAEYHKGGKCVSLRSSRRSEIRDFLEKHSEMEDWLLDTFF